MYKKIYLAMSFILTIWLLSNIYIFSATAIDLENSKGHHLFDLETDDALLISEGFFLINNDEDEYCNITLSIIGGYLVDVDYDKEGNPRKHIISTTAYIYPLMHPEWIKFKNLTFTIPPNTYYTVNYTVEMTKKDAYEAIDENISRGFLCYVNIKGDAKSVVGINYNYKLFITFTGKYQEPIFAGYSSIFLFSSIFLLLSIILLGIVLIKKYIIKRKKVLNLETE